MSNTAINNEEILKLIQRALNGDEVAREKLITAHFKFALGLAKKVYNNGKAMGLKNGKAMELTDLYSVAKMGLVIATDQNNLKKFDPTRAEKPGNIFEKFAKWYVERELYDAVYENLGITKSERNMNKEIKNLKNKILNEGGEWPSDIALQQTLIIEQLGFDRNKLNVLYSKYIAPLSFYGNENEEDNDEPSLYNCIPDEKPSVERQVMATTLLEEIYKEVDDLQRSILDYIQQKQTYHWLMYPRYYGEIAKKINDKYDELPTDKQKAETERIAKAIIGIRKVTEHVYYEADNKMITDIVQCGDQLSNFEQYLSMCIGEYNRESLKEKISSYLKDQNYIAPSKKLKDIFTGGYLTSNGLPLRNELIAISFSEGLNPIQLNDLLKKSGCSELYIRQPEDFALYFALNHGYDAEQYLELCNKIRDIVKLNYIESENEVTVGALKERLNKFSQIENNTLNSEILSSKTITERLFSGAEKLLTKGDEASLLKHIEKNKNSFVVIHERTYRLILERLVNYIEEVSTSYANNYNASATMDNSKPIKERPLKTMGLLKQMVEFCKGDVSKLDKNMNNYLYRMIKSYSASHTKKLFPFEISRDTFLSLMTFLNQFEDYEYDRRSGFIKSMNEYLNTAGFDELDDNLARDKSIINVGVWGKASDENCNNIDYDIFFDGILGIGESKRRSQYSFL